MAIVAELNWQPPTTVHRYLDATSSLLLKQASVLMKQGQAQRLAATDCLRRLLARCPNHAESWFNLGYLLTQGGDFAGALQAYAQALNHNIADPEEAHLNRAVIYADHLQQPTLAKRELANVLVRYPGYQPALLNLGNLHEELGERSEAINCYRQLIAYTKPAVSSAPSTMALEALARLAQLEPPTSAQDVLLTQLRQAAERNAADHVTRSNLWFSLGRAYESLGLTDAAFAAFTSANRYAHISTPAYIPVDSESRIDQLISTFTRPTIGPSTGESKTSPVFICGMFRSGSTLLEQALAAHPAVAAGGELDLLPRILAGPLAPFPETIARLSPQDFVQLAAYYRREVAYRIPGFSGAQLFTDKRPDNFLLIGLIMRLFPEAKIIHTVRHPLDNGLSIFMQHLNPRAFPYAGRLQDIGHYHAQQERLMQHWYAMYPNSIHRFDYDAYVVQPRETLGELFRFLNLHWDERCMAPHQLKNTVKTASYWQVRRPLYPDALGRWRRYQKHLTPLYDALTKAGVAVPAWTSELS